MLLLIGACHGDEAGYLFQGVQTGKPVPGTREYLMLERLTKMWTDFAKTGNPTPGDNSWKPISQENITHLRIDDELELKEKFEEVTNRVWNEIYQLTS